MRTVLILAAATALLATGANAQMFKSKAKPAASPAPAAAAAPAAAPTTTTTNKVFHTSSTATTHAGKLRTPESIDCSKQADAKGLHGNDRKKFRSSCMKAAKH